MRRACIDIGSNTTRLLVADCVAGGLRVIHQERVFTRLAGELRLGEGLSPAKIAEVGQVVAAQLAQAQALGADDVHAVGTAAIRGAPNGAELIAALERGCGVSVRVLSGEEEARLAFVGAVGTLGRRPAGELGVVDVGGGSCELAVGRADGAPRWSASLSVGSGELAEACLTGDPPSAAELARARREVEARLEGLEVPQPEEAVAVGGSATSLRRLAGPLLDGAACDRALALLCGASANEVCRRFALDPIRVRLMPAGLVILEAVSKRFGRPLQVGSGGVREGVLLEAGG